VRWASSATNHGRADPLLELRLFRSVPFSGAIALALLALCGVQRVPVRDTQYLQDIRGHVGAHGRAESATGWRVIAVLSPLTGRIVGAHGPRLPLAVAGTRTGVERRLVALDRAGTALPAVLAIYLLFGVFLGTVNPPINNTALSGMPRSMAGAAASLVSTGRQAGTTLGIAISGTIVASALPRGGTAYTRAEHAVWWLILAIGVAIVALGWASTGRWASHTAQRAATLFETVDQGSDPRTTRVPVIDAGSNVHAHTCRLPIPCEAHHDHGEIRFARRGR